MKILMLLLLLSVVSVTLARVGKREEAADGIQIKGTFYFLDFTFLVDIYT